MAHLSDSTTAQSHNSGMLGDMNYNYLDMPSQSHSKELAPPPVDPFSTNSGLYIPPEESKQSDATIEEILGWVMSDDQQDTEEDDDMDDNEFDLDFEELDYPPPIKPEDQTPGLCQRHLSHPKFSALRSMPYMPPRSAAYPFTSYGAQNSTDPLTSGLNAQMNSNSPPLRFINPSSLILPRKQPSLASGFDPARSRAATNTTSTTTNTAANTSTNTSNMPFNAKQEIPETTSSSIVPQTPASNGAPSTPVYTNVSSPGGGSLSLASPPTSPEVAQFPSPDQMAARLEGPDYTLGLSNMDIDMGMDDLYPIANTPDSDFFDSTDLKPPPAPSQASVSTAPVPEPEPVKEPATPSAPSTPANAAPASTTPVASPGGAAVDVAASTSPRTTTTTRSSVERPSAQHPRRKAPRRRAASHRATSSSAHSSGHICNMKYPDGSECRRSFTRPYDLARHQETLHAAVRKMYTCEVCGENSKTFSRLDALSRHMRLKHS